MTPQGRAAAMAARLTDTAERLGIGTDGIRLIRDAFDAAMAGARGRLDPHHPDALHTARTALILMDDLGVADPVTLAAALAAETRDPGLETGKEALAGLGADVAAIVTAVPRPGNGGPLLELLLTAPPEARLVALAERLDHARHLHLRDAAEWAGFHAATCEAYAPVAARESALLGRRFAWWCATFRRRLPGG